MDASPICFNNNQVQQSIVGFVVINRRPITDCEVHNY